MRQSLKKMGVFLLVLLLLIILMNILMDHETSPHYPLHYEEVFHPKVNADLVILGASQATHGINPKYLESEHLKVFNFALNGAPPLFYLKWYNKIFRHFYRKPTYVIYSVHWVMFDDKFLARQFENDSQYFPFPFFMSQLKESNSLRTLLFNRFAFMKERKKVIQTLFKKKRERYPKEKYYNGFIPFKAREKFRKALATNLEINPVQWKAFDALLNALENDGIRVIFVQTPGYLYAREDQHIAHNVRLLREIAEQRGIPFLDYETKRISSINTNPELFADWTHMNEKGSHAFSELLRQDLEDLLKRHSHTSRSCGSGALRDQRG